MMSLHSLSRNLSLLIAACALFAGFRPAALGQSDSSKPIKALLITGGCCHNYKFQTQALTEGITEKFPVEWTVINEGGNGTRGEIELYSKCDWAAPYDVVVHNECFADTDDPDYIRKITSAHQNGKPAVVIHCAMHTYRSAKIEDWHQFLGVTSRHHDHQSKYPVKPVLKDHPILEGFPEVWTTPMDELYIILKMEPTAQALALSTSEKSGKDQPVIWTNDYHGARVFGTTYGHSDDTFRDPVFINLLARGLAWSVNRLP